MIKSVGKILFYVILAGCSTPNKQSRMFKKTTGVTPSNINVDSSVYARRGYNFKAMTLDFNYRDSGFTGADHSFSLEQNPDLFLLLKAPTFIRKMHYFGTIYYAHPNCNLKAEQNDYGEIELTDVNGNEEKNIELNFFQKLISSTGVLESRFGGFYLNPETIQNIDTVNKLEKKIDSLQNYRLVFLDSMASKFLMSKSFKKLAAEVLHNISIQDSLELYFNLKDLLRKNNLYKNKLENSLNNINCITIYPTYYFDKICQSAFNLVLDKPYWRSMIWSEQEFYDNVDTVKKYFHNMAKDYLLLSQYTMAAKKYTISNSYFNTLINEVKNPTFHSILLREHQFNQQKWAITINSGKKDLLALNGKTSSLEDIFEKHKGKLILLDFWASWCAPCIENMPFSIKLEEFYKSKGIVFVYLSLDKDESKWKVSYFSEKLNRKNSFRFINFKESSFLKNYHIDEIPRYMLIDKAGKIINDNAPSPASDSLKILIDSLL